MTLTSIKFGMWIGGVLTGAGFTLMTLGLLGMVR